MLELHIYLGKYSLPINLHVLKSKRQKFLSHILLYVHILYYVFWSRFYWLNIWQHIQIILNFFISTCLKTIGYSVISPLWLQMIVSIYLIRALFTIWKTIAAQCHPMLYAFCAWGFVLVFSFFLFFSWFLYLLCDHVKIMLMDHCCIQPPRTVIFTLWLLSFCLFFYFIFIKRNWTLYVKYYFWC